MLWEEGTKVNEEGTKVVGIWKGRLKGNSRQGLVSKPGFSEKKNISSKVTVV